MERRKWGCVVSRLVIEPESGLRGIDWRELYRYRDMFRFLTLRTIKARYAQSVIGIGWAVIQPLFSMLVFTVVFGRLAKVSSDGAPYALFSFVALVPWTFFSNALNDSTSSLISQATMLSKVHFPRMILPLSAVAAKLVDFVIALLVLFVMMAFYRVTPTSGVFAIPFLILIMVAAATGAGMWLTSLAVQYRDVSYAMGFFVQLLMYAAPVVYPASLIPERFQAVYALNPMVGVIEGFRAALLGTREMPWAMISLGAATAGVLLVSGALYFRMKERIFADVA
jgi:lipopolysaccharide transport system permease protein